MCQVFQEDTAGAVFPDSSCTQTQRVHRPNLVNAGIQTKASPHGVLQRVVWSEYLGNLDIDVTVEAAVSVIWKDFLKRL